MSPYDHARIDAERDPRRAESRRRRARTGVVIIDDDISWSTVPRRPRRVSGPIARDVASRADFDVASRADLDASRRAGTDVDLYTDADVERERADADRRAASRATTDSRFRSVVAELVADTSDAEDDWAGAGDLLPGTDLEPARSTARAVQLASDGRAPGDRRTVVITGRVADRYAPVRRGGYESSLRRHERSNFQPDRVALWAVLLGVLLVLIAAGSSHAATIAAHLPR